MFNKAILCGRLTKNPETNTSPSGTVVTRFTLAIDRRFSRDETDFLNIVTFNKTAEFVQKYFTKGQMALVSGSIQTRSWDGADGQRKYATDIVAEEVNFCGSKKSENSDGMTSYTPEEAADVLDGLRNEFTPLDNDDSLPF